MFETYKQKRMIELMKIENVINQAESKVFVTTAEVCANGGLTSSASLNCTCFHRVAHEIVDS